MRIALIAVFLACMISGTNPAMPIPADERALVNDGFFERLNKMIPALSGRLSNDRFAIDTAEWIEDERLLVVSVSTTHQKGTLLTLMGLPASTMVDAFRISADHSATYSVPLDKGQAIPCQVIVKSAFRSETISVAKAPAACHSLYQVSGTVAVGPTMPMVNGWVTVTVDDLIFATISDQSGRYSLQVYNDSNDALVTITAEGMLDEKESVVHIFSGSINSLLAPANTKAAAWAEEIMGRRHFRLMLATLGASGAPHPPVM